MAMTTRRQEGTPGFLEDLSIQTGAADMKRRSWNVLLIVLVVMGLAGCGRDPFAGDCEETPLAIADIQLPNGTVDSSYVVVILDLVKEYGVRTIDHAENLDEDSIAAYGIFVGRMFAGENPLIGGNLKVPGKNISFRIRITEPPRFGCQPRISTFKVLIPEIRQHPAILDAEASGPN